MISTKLSLLTLLAAFACLHWNCSAVRRAATLPKQDSLLWEISGNGLSAPSYLFGTIHIITEDKLFIPNKAILALKKSKILLLELDISNPQVRAEYVQYVNMPVGVQLSALLGRHEYATLHRFLEDSVGLNLGQLNHWKPFLISSIIMQKSLKGNVVSYEEILAKRARAANMKIAELETLAFQMSIFDKISYTDQAQILMSNVVEYDYMRQTYQTMVSLYLDQQSHKLYEFARKYTREYQDFEEVLLVQRNKNWIPRIESQMRTAPTFVAVGAGHLAGNNGVLRLLEKAGYKVKPIR